MFVVLEGLDGAGKSTQVRRLRRFFEERGLGVEYLHFPRFDAPVYGELIARFLRGEFGAADEVDSYLVALLFAGDRAGAAAQIRAWLAGGRVVLLDRYVWSNVAYQCAKLRGSDDERRRLGRCGIVGVAVAATAGKKRRSGEQKSQKTFHRQNGFCVAVKRGFPKRPSPCHG